MIARIEQIPAFLFSKTKGKKLKIGCLQIQIFRVDLSLCQKRIYILNKTKPFFSGLLKRNSE